MYKVYNFKHRRWEAALVMPRSRRCRRSSLLRICNASQLLQTTRRSPYRQSKKHETNSKKKKNRKNALPPPPDATETLVSLRRMSSPGKQSSSSSSSSQSPSKQQSVREMVLAYDREISALARCSQLAVTGTASNITETVRLSTEDKGLSKVDAWRQFPHYLRVSL